MANGKSGQAQDNATISREVVTDDISLNDDTSHTAIKD